MGDACPPFASWSTRVVCGFAENEESSVPSSQDAQGLGWGGLLMDAPMGAHSTRCSSSWKFIRHSYCTSSLVDTLPPYPSWYLIVTNSGWPTWWKRSASWCSQYVRYLLTVVDMVTPMGWRLQPE